MITATVLTKNSEKTLKATLDSLKKFPEVILLDSGSQDRTVAIGQTYPNVIVHSSPFLGFGPMHNAATKLASYDWILSIDSDEILSKDLIEEILSLKLNPQFAYRIFRHNYFNGKWVKCCGGWHPDGVIRLYHREKTAFSLDNVHEKVVIEGMKVKNLHSPLLHTPYLQIEDFLTKMQHYSTLFAQQHQGRKVSVFQALVHGWHAFIKSYLFKKGFMGGKEGLIISIYNGHASYYKYLKLAIKD